MIRQILPMNPATTIRRLARDWWISLMLGGRLWRPDGADHLTERFLHVDPIESIEEWENYCELGGSE